MSRKIVLVTSGSLGDLHPFIALARELKHHRPVIASLPEYQQTVTAEGIAFHPVRPGFEQLLADLRMDARSFAQRAMRNSEFLFRHAVFPYLRVAYEDLSTVMDDADLVVTHSLSFAARLAAEKRGLPQLAIVLQPLMFMSAHDLPRHPDAPWLTPLLSWLGPRVSVPVVRWLKRSVARRAAEVQALRRELGLPPTTSDAVFDGQFSGAGAIGLYSPLLGTVESDFPPHTTIAGFTFYDGSEAAYVRSEGTEGRASNAPAAERQRLAALTRFMESGDPPIVFTLGSFAPLAGDEFYRLAVAAARRLNTRAVLLLGAHAALRLGGTAEDAKVADASASYLADGADIHVCDYAPYSQLFPRAAAIVHHGGIGTLAQALRAGRPQLIVPFFADQPDNAARAARLGVARTLSRRRLSAARLAAELRALIDTPAYAAAGLEVAARVRCEDGARQAALVIDQALHARSPGAATLAAHGQAPLARHR